MTFNTALAVKVLAHIEDLNDSDTRIEHNQTVWSQVSVPSQIYDAIYDKKTGKLAGYGSCGTAGCFAGWTTHLDGLSIRYYPVERGPAFLQGLLAKPAQDILLIADEVEDGRSISRAACDALGIHVPEVTFDCYHEEYDSTEDCRCELSESGWDYDENMPLMFNAGNDMDMLYGYVAEYSGRKVQEIRDMVAEEREKFVFDIEQWSLVEKAPEIPEVSHAIS